mmetsp:Transcript_64410/g.172391  ORF Transcript_64410/g.172391 Transcript_64410/m.172391 type:complete len:99 (+) Transcript_64410:1562-1858(+)
MLGRKKLLLERKGKGVRSASAAKLLRRLISSWSSVILLLMEPGFHQSVLPPQLPQPQRLLLKQPPLQKPPLDLLSGRGNERKRQGVQQPERRLEKRRH